MLEKHAKPRVEGHPLLLVGLVVVRSEDFYAARAARQKPQDGAHQHGLARPGGSDEPQDLAAIDVEVQLVEHDVGAEADGHVADRQYHLPALSILLLQIRFPHSAAPRSRSRSRRSRRRHP